VELVSPFNLQDYEPVEERLARFWQDHPNGRIHTELVNSHAGSVLDQSQSVIVIASVYKDKADLYPAATGHAQETPGSNPVNKTSWVENCETSAIGRALANMGYAPKGQRPSREEMSKVAPARPSSGGGSKTAAPSTSPPPARRRDTKRPPPRGKKLELLQAAKDAEVDGDLRHRVTRMFTGKESVYELTSDECEKVIKQLAWLSAHRSSALEALAAWEAENGLA